MNNVAYAWLILATSVLAEVIGTLALRYAEGFTRPIPSVLTLACYVCAIWLMSISIKHIEVGLSYAVWAGSGTAIIAILGMLFFQESTSLLRMSGLAFIVLGVVALNLSSH